MDYKKIGSLIRTLRQDKKLTQKQVADALYISDKTVSKWERGAGCPDISLLRELSRVLEVNLEKMLSGELNRNRRAGGCMKKIGFYVCPDCGNVIVELDRAQVSCCGKVLKPQPVTKADAEHNYWLEKIEDEEYLVFQHDMKKDHYLSFVAQISYDRVLLVKLYPQQEAAVRLPSGGRGKRYAYCVKHGLMEL